METLRVLICDDEKGMRMGVSRALQHFTAEVAEFNGAVAFTVDEAETGEECLERIQEEAPHILLLDLKLPGMSGLDVLEKLAGRTHEILTIMITAYASIEAAVRATKQGAYDFLPKPFTPSELRNTVRRAARHVIVERQARNLAEEKRRVRFEFISVLAHELKAPINAIEGYLHLLEPGAPGDKPETRNQIIGRCVTRIEGMRKLIFDLLDLTRIESGQKPRNIGPVDVRELAHAAIETAKPEADARDIEIALEADASVEMTGDPGEIEIILNNLVSNAVKYNKDQGKVTIRLHRDEDTITFSVTDTGIGLKKEDAARLFQDFVRIRNEQTQHVLGSGLGLSTVKKLAVLYNGDVHVDSEPGKGSTFTVTLKDAEPATESGEQSSQSSSSNH